MADGTKQRAVVIARVLDGPGKASSAKRRAAFGNAGVEPAPATALIDKVARNAYKVIDEDVAAVKAAGVAEDEIFEIVVAAALGQASRQLDAALAALEDA